jgi:geranylgeranyl diphosphate synthase type I
LKSGRYTVTRPLELGLALGGAVDRGLAISLRAYGDAIGLAFQLRDDILGVFGDPATTGKSCLDDLRAGKRTVLVAQTMALASSAQQGVLRGALGNPHLDEGVADCCRHIIAGTGALAAVEAVVRGHHSVAVAAIADVPEPARTALVALAAAAVDRDR